MLNEPTKKRLHKICERISAGENVSSHDAEWAQKLAIFDETAQYFLKKVDLYLEPDHFIEKAISEQDNNSSTPSQENIEDSL
jgi:hypothetical protein